MKKHLFLLVSCMLSSLFCSLSASADDECLYLDYCDDLIADNAQGKTGSKKNIEAAIYLTADMLKPYIGCQVSGVMAGFPSDSKLPSTVTGWLRVDKTSAAKTATSTEQTPTTGWNKLSFGEPYTITGQEEGIYVGFRYYQASKLNCLSFVGNANANGAYLCTESTGTPVTINWSSVSGTMQGNLSIRAIITGNIPQHDLQLTNMKLKNTIVQIGESIVVSGTVKNNANTVAHMPKIKYSLNGTEMGQYPVVTASTLAYRQTADFSISIPTTSITEPMTAKVDLELVWADGSADDYAADNVATFLPEVATQVYHRKMVTEEGTGTWCGWCVRGYVGLKTMKAEYPDQFIGIGVHNNDEFEYDPYDSWMSKHITGYPSALINRDGNVYDPGYSVLSTAYDKMDKVAVAGVAVAAKLDGDQLTMTSHVTMAANLDHEVRVAFVVLEDSVMTSQHNYYSGGGYGAMGGFESLGNPTSIPMMDAARYISNVNGDEGSVSTTPQKGVTYDYTATVDLTSIGDNQVENKQHLSVVAILIDQQTGEILNGEKTEDLSGTDAISGIQINTPQAKAVFDLSGRRVNAARKGLYIINGKKVIK